jgi:membrane protease YdiL (CAAX protease family)
MKLSKYHGIVISLYALILTYSIFFAHNLPLNFSYRPGDAMILLIVCLISFPAALFTAHIIHFGRFRIHNTSLLPAIVIYASIFAIAEEIIFRGLIQGILQISFSLSYVAVILSALIYGLAHAFNGAKNITPNGWNWKLIILTSVVGLPLGASYVLTGSLLIPTILHTLMIIGLKTYLE